MFALHDLLAFEDIVVQCHDHPDADTLAAAFALYVYLSEKGKAAKIIYSGRTEITKPNLMAMIGLLGIPIEYAKQLPLLEALVVVDGQYGEGNVTKFTAKNIFQIDHHVDKNNGCGGIVNSQLGSCSTLMWDLLNKEKFSTQARVSTALYYGLYADTSGFEEIAHPLDKDLRDEKFFDPGIFNTLRFNNLTIDELRIAGLALTQYKIDKDNRFAIFCSEECDPNVLGFISDLALQVDGVDICVVYNTLPGGYKLSVRSCTREVMASDIAHFLSGGGGHAHKAGGFISKEQLEKSSINEHLSKLSKIYFSSYDTVDAADHHLNISSMPKYVKRKIPVGHVLSTDVFAAGTPMLIRTLEGDSDVFASENILLMIGAEGEVYPIDSEKFLRSYAMTEIGFIKDYAYSPTAKNKITGESVSLIAYAKPCMPTGQSTIHAVPISKRTKVFTKWNPGSYMLGEAGDFIAVRADDYNDVYIIKGKIFYDTYESVNNRSRLHNKLQPAYI